MVAAGTITAETAAGISAAAGAVAAGAATTATVSTINNRGNLGAVFKDVTSSDAMKGYVISGATAGLTAAYFDGWTGTETSTATEKVVTSRPLSTWSGVGQFAANQGLQNGTSMLLSKALGQDASAGGALKNALFNTLAAASFNMVGDYTKNVFADGSTPKIAIHAMVGGLLAEATGGDFKTGALAAGASEALVTHLDTLVKGNDNLLTMSSQIVGVVAAAAQEDTDAAKLDKGSWIARNATQYNFLNHRDVRELEVAEKKCHIQGTCDQVKKEFDARSAANRARLDNCKATNNCAQIRAELDEGSKEIVASIARTEQLDPGGSSNDLMFGYRTVNEQEWTVAGLLHLDQTANMWLKGDPAWLSEVGAYLDQTGFNPFGISVVPGMLPGGGAGGVGTAEAKPSGLTKGPVAETGAPKWDTPQSRVDGEFGGANSGKKQVQAVPNLTERGTLTNVFPTDPAVSQRPVRTLIQDESGRYWLQGQGGRRITPSGAYDFVTLPNGTIKVSRSNINEGFSTHLGLSGGEEVKYAGSIRFGNNEGPERGTIKMWDNSSGHYKPPASLKDNSGLPEKLFKPK